MNKRRNGLSRDWPQAKTVKYRILASGPGGTLTTADLHLLEQFHATISLYRSCVSFYVSVLKEHLHTLDLSSGPGPAALQQKQRTLEKLTHRTKHNPNPSCDLDTIGKNIPAYFRRSAINAAVGIVGSWGSNYTRIRGPRPATGGTTSNRKNRNGRSNRPPTLRLQNSQWPVYFKDLYKQFDDRNRTVMLKLHTGSAWVWRKVRISTTQPLPPDTETKSLKIVIKGARAYLHRTIVRVGSLPSTSTNRPFLPRGFSPATRILSVDLNLSRAVVMTVLGYDGRVHRVKFIRSTRDNHRRKKYLDMITRKLGETKVIPESKAFCKDLWNKVRHLNDDLGHQLSRQVVNVALASGCEVIVFEHLGNLRPAKGSRSRRMNSKLMYWLKGSIYKKTLYKARWEGVKIARVNPQYTSQMCNKHHSILVHTKPEGTDRPNQRKFVCTVCGYEVDADFNGSVNVGRRYYGREKVRALRFKALGGNIQAWDKAIGFISGCMNPLDYGPGSSRAEAAGSTIQSACSDACTHAAPLPNPGQVEVP